MVWKRNEIIHLCETGTTRGATEEVAYDITTTSPTYNAVLSSLPRQLDNHSHLGSPGPNNPHDGQLGQQPTSDTPTQSLKAPNSSSGS